MPLSVGTGVSNTLLGGGFGEPKSKGDIQNTIDRLERQREDFEKQRAENTGAMLDNRIKNLEDRISNLRERMNKLEQQDGECQTCENRRYQDGSDDPGVSFKNASKISGNVEAAVRGHEQEHVSRNQAEAEREGREIVYQSVVIKHAICPECGTTYVAGGETTTVTRAKHENDNELSVEKTSDGNGSLSEKTYGVLNGDDGKAGRAESSVRLPGDTEKPENPEKPDPEQVVKEDERFSVGLYDRANMMGQLLNIVA